MTEEQHTKKVIRDYLAYAENQLPKPDGKPVTASLVIQRLEAAENENTKLLKRIEEQTALLKRSIDELLNYMDVRADDAHACCHTFGWHDNACPALALHTDIAKHLEANNG